MVNMSPLIGDEIDRYLFLLNRNIPFPKALIEAHNPESDLLFPEEELLELLRSYPDPWVHSTVKANCTAFATDFRKAFRLHLGFGKTIEEAADAALRTSDSLATARYDQPKLRRAEAIKLGKIRLALANTSAVPITKEEFIGVAAKLRKRCMRDRNIETETVPHIVDIAFMERFGYIQITCVDKDSAMWLVEFLHSAPVWRNASVCLMHERKFKRSYILSSCLEESLSDDADGILGNLKKLNPDVNMCKWKILTRSLNDDGKTVKIHTLIPRSDLKMLQLKNYELNYKNNKAKFTVLTKVHEVKKKLEKIFLQGLFPDSLEGNILEHIECENDDIDTFQWKVIREEQLIQNGETYVWLHFYVDGQSADVIEQSNSEINFMSQKIKLSRQKDKTLIKKIKSQPIE